MLVYNNQQAIVSYKTTYSQYKPVYCRNNQISSDTVSFTGNIVNSLEKIIQYEDKLKKCNPDILLAKQELLKFILSGTKNWSGVKTKVKMNPKYNLKTLSEEFGTDLTRFLSFSDLKSGRLRYTGKTVKCILNKLGVTKDNAPEQYNIIVKPFMDNSMIKIFEELIDYNKNIMCNPDIFEPKTILLEYMLNGTKKWPGGIKAKVQENLEYTISDMAKDMHIPKNMMSSFTHFLSKYDQRECGKLSYTQELGMHLIKRLGVENELYLREFNSSTKRL